jgi:hypothetical protein
MVVDFQMFNANAEFLAELFLRGFFLKQNDRYEQHHNHLSSKSI